MERNYLDLLDELRSIAQLGLNYSKDPYDLDRYHKLLNLAANNYHYFTGLPSEDIKQRFNKDLGYITPKIGVNGVLFNSSGLMLLELRSDDGLWGIPGGWVDASESPETAIKREFMEECNFIVEPLEIIRLDTRMPGDFNQPHTSVHLLYYCKYISGDLKTSHESLEMCYRDYNQVTNWHKDHGRLIQEAVAYHNRSSKS